MAYADREFRTDRVEDDRVDLTAREGTWEHWVLRDIDRKAKLKPGLFQRWAECGRPPTHGGFVYFVKPDDENVVKIGVARRVLKRLDSLQIGSWKKLRIVGLIPGKSVNERALHKSFAHLHIRGEWFEYGVDLRPFVERVASVGRLDGEDPLDFRRALRLRVKTPEDIQLEEDSEAIDRALEEFEMSFSKSDPNKSARTDLIGQEFGFKDDWRPTHC